MAMTTAANSGGPLLSPAQVGELLVQPVISASIATTVSTVVPISSGSYRVPLVTADPTAAWVAEGSEITPSDLSLSELTVTPRKLAGLSIISSELANDTSPAAAEAVGQGLARDCARKLDAAFFGSLASPAPAGLGSLSGVSTVSAGAAFANVDAFSEALSVAEGVGAQLTAFVCNPATALVLAKLKKGSGSNEPLFAAGGDATTTARRQVAGVPLYVSPAVANGVVWGIDGSRSLVVLRQDAEVTSDASVFYTSDRVAVRAILRASFGWPHAASVVKVSTTA